MKREKTLAGLQRGQAGTLADAHMSDTGIEHRSEPRHVRCASSNSTCNRTSPQGPDMSVNGRNSVWFSRVPSVDHVLALNTPRCSGELNFVNDSPIFR